MTDKHARIIEAAGGWYFLTQEGPKGPFVNDTEAKLALSRYLIEMLLDEEENVVPIMPHAQTNRSHASRA